MSDFIEYNQEVKIYLDLEAVKKKKKKVLFTEWWGREVITTSPRTSTWFIFKWIWSKGLSGSFFLIEQWYRQTT